jgi:hypothetical protein
MFFTIKKINKKMDHRLRHFMQHYLSRFITVGVCETKQLSRIEGNVLFVVTIQLLNKKIFILPCSEGLFTHVIALVFKNLYNNNEDKQFRKVWFKENKERFSRICMVIYEEWIYGNLKPFVPTELVYTTSFRENNTKSFDDKKSHAIYRSLVKYL